VPEPHYSQELALFESTYEYALGADISALMKAVAGASLSSLVSVGSGGSFTVASLLCNLHESFTGQVSRPSVPLEIICNPTLAANSPVFFVSAEGKNPDIVEALQRARTHSSRQIHILSNRTDSPLSAAAATLREVTFHNFELVNKDGYLATNSLLLDATLVARAYNELASIGSSFPPTIKHLNLGLLSISEWLGDAKEFARKCASRRGVIVVYAPSLRAVAADLESKLSESALLYCQTADLRSFAHGRHLWLTERPGDCAILALTDHDTKDVWALTRSLIPKDIPTQELHVPGGSPADLIAALIAEMHFVDLIAETAGKDPGRPPVGAFGRDLYYADVRSLVPKQERASDGGLRDKLAAISARWPYDLEKGLVKRARDAYIAELSSQEFGALVLDYDGTLCAPGSRESPPSNDVVELLRGLLDREIKVAVVSGRGDSVRSDLRKVLPATYWPRIQLGLYNGGWQTTVANEDEPNLETSEFLNHVCRIVRGLRRIGVPIEELSPKSPFQVSIRFKEGIDTEIAWYVIADALRQAGLSVSGVVRSRHSVDVLGPEISKTKAISALIREHRLLPQQVLTVGDQGAWPGNDATLLEHRFSLSVDYPSRRLDRGWKVAPFHLRGVDATVWYLQRMAIKTGSFRIGLADVASSLMQ
jgi:fructoselysine-6-P-deglycase FrlB-like protein